MKRSMKKRFSRAFCLAYAAVFCAGTILSQNTLPAKAATDPGIKLDGQTEDWDNIKKIVVDENNYSQLAAFTTDEDLYIMREFIDVTDWGVDQFYIDADGNEKNGLNLAGVDYLLEGGSLYEYNGEGGAWSWGTTHPFEVKMSDDKAVAEYRIPLSSIGNPKGKVRLNIHAFTSAWTAFSAYPDSGMSMFDVSKYDDVYQESTTEVITDFSFEVDGELRALTEKTKKGGVVGTFSAAGGNGKYSYSLVASGAYGANNSQFKIDGDKLVVKDGMLAPGKYSIFVKVRSDIRSEKKAFTFRVEAADSATPIDEDIFSGADGQWFTVDHNSVNLAANLTEIKSVCDDDYFYAYVGAETLSDKTEFYIGTVKAGGDDMSDAWKDGDNVTYKVAMDGTVYAFNEEYAKCGEASVYKTGNGAEIKVALSVLGDASGQIKVGVKDGESNILPNKGKSMLSCTTPIKGEVPVITLDGDNSDWEGMSRIGEGVGTLGDLYAFRDEDNLYVYTTVTNADFSLSSAVSTNLLINADGDVNTGYQNGSYAESGADFLVQDWFSCDVGDEKKNIELFWTEQKLWTWTNISGHNAYKVYQDKGDYVVIEYVLPFADIEEVGIPITDDLKIAIDRAQLQGGTPEGRTPSGDFFATVPRAHAEVNVSLENGTFDDWITVANTAKDFAAQADLNFVATKSSERLYTLVTSEAGGLNTVNTYYISTGKDTGYEFTGYSNIDYIVRDAKLFAVTGDNELSESLGSVWMNYYDKSVEMQLYLSQIGNPSEIYVGWRGVDGFFAIPTESLMEVTASFNLAREEGYYYPTENFDSFSNPYKGWVGWARDYQYDVNGEYAFDQKASYIAVRWSEFEPEKGKYDFEGISEKYGFDHWKEKGVRLNVRFVMDNPEVLEDGQTQRMDIPQWLYDELVTETEKGNIDSPGTFYNDVPNLGGAGFSPNYNSELLLKYHDEVIKKLAEYFDDNSLTAFVQIGSLGHWAEFHTWPEGTGVFPAPEMATKYMESYVKYFKNVKYGLRKPYPYAAENNFGLFNDIFGVSTYSGTYTYLDWINNGDTDIPYATEEDVQNSKMPDFWKYNYSGGEFAEGNIKLHLDNAGIVGCIQQVRDTHVSWLGPCSPAGILTDDIFATLNEANILAIQKQMGYNYFLEKITKAEAIITGTETTLSMVWNNEGVAPFYYDWPLEFSLLDASGNVVDKQVVYADIKNWMPGRTKVEQPVKFSNKVATGEYTLAVAILDKDSMEPSIKLAVAGGREDLRYPLYKVTVTNSGKTDDDNGESGNSGETPNPSESGNSAAEGTTPHNPTVEPSSSGATSEPAQVKTEEKGIKAGKSGKAKSGEKVKASKDGKSVAVTKASNKKNTSIKAKVTVNGKKYPVTGLSSKSTGSKAKKITIDGKYLKTVSANAFMNSKKLTKIVVKHVKKNSKIAKQIIKAANKLSKKTGKKVSVVFK